MADTNTAVPDGGPAFPREDGFYNGRRSDGGIGMSLRDYFAGQELLRHVNKQCDVHDIPSAYDRLAKHCYAMADAMLSARKEGGAA